VLYDPPTSAASGVVLDIDFDETFTIEARDAAGVVIQSVTIKAGDPDTGDGLATRWAIDRGAADIHSIRFVGRRTAAGGFGLGFDNFCSRSRASGALLQLSLDASLLFDFDRAVLRPEADATLSSAAGQIASYPGTQIIVEGHTDSIGSATYNRDLSERRASVVVERLRSMLAAGDFIFVSIGYGDTRPIAGNQTSAGRQRNRRVEIRVSAAPGR
jgi:outer membrane protein OmpA-like peptidoglycan-associated protein